MFICGLKSQIMKILNEILSVITDLNSTLKDFSKKENLLEDPLTIESACEILKKSKSDVYALISTNAPDPIPHHRKGRKTIYFFRSELILWVKSKNSS